MSNPLKDLGLSSEELKAIAEIRGIKGYKIMSKGELLSVLTPSKPAKKVKNQKQVFLKQKQKRSEKNLMNQDINFIN